MKTVFLQSDLGLFIGRLHPLVVHLPIGFLFLAGLFYFLGRKEKYNFLNQALPISFFLSAISAIVATLFGLLLATSGGYEEGVLSWHKWMGFAVSIISTLAWVISSKRFGATKQVPLWGMIALLALLIITGHLGGSLTHGKDYLTAYAPAFLKSNQSTTNSVRAYPDEPDSTKIFEHVIQPILQEKCVSCHNENKQKGGLLLNTPEGIMKGGDGGKVLVKNAPMESELLRRVTLPPDNRKFMPPSGMPMTYQEIKLLDFWISDGLSLDLSITDSLPKDIETILDRQFGLSRQWKSFVEKQQVDPADPGKVAKLQEKGFVINPISEDIHFLEATPTHSVTLDQLKALSGVQEQISWLNLGKMDIKDAWLNTIGNLPNLTKLRLDNNPITDQGLSHLSQLYHLEVLNLYGTQIGDDGLETIGQLPALKKLYLWQTKVTPEAVEKLRSERPSLLVDIGNEIPAEPETTTEAGDS